MSKFSGYVDSLKQQTDLLRDNLTAASGIDCSKMNIGNCAQIIQQHITEPVEQEGYVRPSWYPNIKEILASAPEVEKDGVVYYPCYIMLCNTTENIQTFYRNYSSSSVAINYYDATGCDAILFSDNCDNDVSKADAQTLEVGTIIQHKWDVDKDIVNDIDHSQKVRWLIGYGISSTYNGALYNMRINNNQYCIELVFGPVKMFSNFLSSPMFSGDDTIYNTVLKYIDAGDIVGKTNPSAMCAGLIALEEMGLPEIDLTNSNKYYHNLRYCYNLKKLTSKYGEWSLPMGHSTLRDSAITHANIDGSVTRYNDYCFADCHNLKSVSIPAGVTTIGSYFCYNCEKLDALVIPDTVTNINGNLCSRCYNLTTLILPQNLETLGDYCLYRTPIARVDLPSSLKTLTTSANAFTNTQYVGLWNDFNMSGTNFKGAIVKSEQWFKDLCVWLMDRTGLTANSMIIGARNIAKAQTMWLTFNPDDKRDITWVDEGTEGAINIVQFITEQLNWTLS